LPTPNFIPTARAQELDLKAWQRLYKLAEKHQLLD